MRTGILIISTLVCLAMALPAFGQQDAAAIKPELLASYAKLQKALADVDFSAYLKAKAPLKPNSAQPSEGEFKQAVSFLKTMYPQLDPKDFIQVTRIGSLAGYYFQKHDEPNYVTVSLVKFHLVNGQWKVGDTAESSTPANPKLEVQAQVAKILKTSKTLALKE